MDGPTFTLESVFIMQNAGVKETLCVQPQSVRIKDLFRRQKKKSCIGTTAHNYLLWFVVSWRGGKLDQKAMVSVFYTILSSEKNFVLTKNVMLSIGVRV